jgi:hypothetical protein
LTALHQVWNVTWSLYYETSLGRNWLLNVVSYRVWHCLSLLPRLIFSGNGGKLPLDWEYLEGLHSVGLQACMTMSDKGESDQKPMANCSAKLMSLNVIKYSLLVFMCKEIFACHWRRGKISKSVCPWQAFPAKCNIS